MLKPVESLFYMCRQDDQLILVDWSERWTTPVGKQLSKIQTTSLAQLMKLVETLS